MNTRDKLHFIPQLQKELSVLPDGANVWVVFNTEVKPNEPERVFVDAAHASLWMASSGYAIALDRRPFHIYREANSDLSMLKEGHTSAGEVEIRKWLRERRARAVSVSIIDKPVDPNCRTQDGRFLAVDWERKP